MARGLPADRRNPKSNPKRKLRAFQTSFTAGELDPQMRMRSDLKAFFSGARSLQNASLLVQGGAKRRDGTRYRADLGAESILHEFSFTEGQDYVLAFQNTKVLIYDSDGTLLQTLTGMPWTLAQVKELTLAASADTIIVCHKDVPIHRILRTGATTFTEAAFVFEVDTSGNPHNQPYYKFTSNTVTMTPGATTGSTTLTCSTAHFKTDDVGSRYRYGTTADATLWKEVIITAHTELTTNGTFASDASWTKGTGWTIAAGVASCDGTQAGDSDLEQANAAVNTQEYTVKFTLSGVTAGSISVLLCDGAESAQYDTNGTYEIFVTAAAGSNLQFRADVDFVGSIDDVTCFSADIANIDVEETLAATTAQVHWDEQTFSTRRGYPRAVCFHDQRLCLAGSTSRPDGFWASQTGGFFNFDPDDATAEDAIDATVSADQVAEIRHLVSSRNIQLFTNGGELYIPVSAGNPLTPGNVQFLPQTPFGCEQKVNPIKFDGATLFLQKTGTVIREFIFNDIEQAHTSNAVSPTSNHLLKTVVDSAVLLGTDTRPEQYAFFVNSDGTAAVFHSVRNEELAGWVPWDSLGESGADKFLSFTQAGTKLFCATERTVNAGTVYWLEEFDPDLTLDAASKFDTSTELSTNGTFASDASWTKGTGWTIASGVASCDGSAGGDTDLEQTSAAVSTTVYRVQFTLSNVTAGTITPRVTDGAGSSESADGTYVQFITASTGSNLQFRADSDFVGDLDDVTVTEVALAFTAAHLDTIAVEGVTNSARQFMKSVTTDGSGVATFDEYVNNAHVGLDYTFDIETMPPDAVKGSGTLMGVKKKIGRVVVSVIDTRSLNVGGNELVLTGVDDDFSLTPSLVENDYEFFLTGWCIDPTVVITQTYPLHATVRGLYMEVMA
jgi:hypothetical protein